MTGSTMSAMTVTVGRAKNGSILTVSQSGTISMSLLLIGCQARIELPSNPKPSVISSSPMTAIG